MQSVIRIDIPIPFPIRSVNAYFIPDTIPTLIDAGFHSEEGLEKVELAIKRTGYRLTDVKRILLTHGHMDHAGLAGKIAETSGAEVFVHPLDRDKCIWDVRKNQEEKMAPFLRFFKESGLSDAVINDMAKRMSDRFSRFFPGEFDAVKYIEGDEVFFFDDFMLKVVYSPGHTLGSVCFFDRENGMLFSGDHLLENTTSNPQVEFESRHKIDGYKSLASYLKSLDMIAAMEIIKVLPGHGAPFSNAAKRAEEIIRHHRMRKKEVLSAFTDKKSGCCDPGGLPLFTITRAIFPQLRGWAIFLGLSETYGHLEVLEDEGLITSRMVEDNRLYCLRASDGLKT